MSGIEKKVTDRYVRWAILSVRIAGLQKPQWEQWADDWLDGTDRSAEAARAAACAAAWEAAEAAWAEAAWAAAEAAWAAARAWAAWAAWKEVAARASAAQAAQRATDAEGARRVAELARDCGLPLTCDAWRARDLMPKTDASRVLVWKHVNANGQGNLGFPYRVGEEFACVGQVCAGPFGALRDWSDGDRDPHVLAIAGECYDVDPALGVYLCLAGLPVALYRATDITDDGFTPVLIEGEDAMRCLTRPQDPRWKVILRDLPNRSGERVAALTRSRAVCATLPQDGRNPEW